MRYYLHKNSWGKIIANSEAVNSSLQKDFSIHRKFIFHDEKSGEIIQTHLLVVLQKIATSVVLR